MLWVLSRDQDARLFASACSPKCRAALLVAYGAGLRANEVVALKVTDVDSGRLVSRVEQGKGYKDHNAMLSPVLLIGHICSMRFCPRMAKGQARP